MGLMDTRLPIPATRSPTPPPQPFLRMTVDPRIRPAWARWIWIALATGLCLWVGYMVREIWVPLAIAFLIAMVLHPIVDRMERRGFSRMWGALLIFIGFICTAGVTLYFAV